MTIIKLLAVEIKKSMPIFLALCIINVFFFIASMFTDSVMFELIAFMFTLIAYSLMICYVFISLYHDLYLGKDILLHLTPIKTSTVLIIKNIVYVLGFLLFWLPSLARILYGKSGIAELIFSSLDHTWFILTYMNFTKLLGIVAGTMLITSIIACSKKIKNRVGSLVFIGLTYLLIIVGTIIGIIYRYENTFENIEVTIGMGTNDLFIFDQYATFIPIKILPINPFIETVMDTAFTEQLLINSFIIITSYIIFVLVVDYTKNDYPGK